jgi:AcrR family transcriptional regulator
MAPGLTAGIGWVAEVLYRSIMANASVPEPGETRGVGRPSRISRQMIAEAASELGLDRLTLKAVADRLGVTIPALYHHVAGKEDLLRLVAEYSVSQVEQPQAVGQHWAVLLYEWAEYNRDAFVSESGLLAHYIEGAISPVVIAANVDGILGGLVQQGFLIGEANDAYELAVSCAVGTAVAELRAREVGAPSASPGDAYRAALDLLEEDELPQLRALATQPARPRQEVFRAKITTVLMGIAVRRGEPWEPIASLVQAARP